LRLLRLSPEILNRIPAPGDPISQSLVTERTREAFTDSAEYGDRGYPSLGDLTETRRMMLVK